MREILFRGKRTENGEWLEGFYEKTSGRHFIVNGFTNALQYVQKEVIPETVGQYTGLKDKNGKKIFEGDVLRLRDSWSAWAAIVEFGNPNGLYSWGWQLKPIRRVSVNTDILCWVEMEDAGAFCEVIGTIHDNKELLNEN